MKIEKNPSNTYAALFLILFISVSLIPGLNRTFRYYAATFFFGLFMGEIFNSLFFGISAVVKNIINGIRKFFKARTLANTVILIISLLGGAYCVYIVILFVNAGYFRPVVKIPWWFIFVGFAADFLFYSFKNKVGKKRIDRL